MPRYGWALGILAAISFGGRSAVRHPPNAVNLTLYHIGPEWYPVLPTNQDTADWRGHVTFSFLSSLEHYDCSLNSTSEWCKNPEIFTPSSQLVATRLILEVDPQFETYGQCNMCIQGHVFNHPDCPCRKGAYVCSCVEESNGCAGVGGNIGCGSGVGRETLTGYPGVCNASSFETHCWYLNGCHKLSGTWYSTFAAGNCDSPTSVRCAWRMVEVTDRISYACIESAVQTAVEALDPQCFRRCGPRSFTSACYARCFYPLLLGPEADRSRTIAGLPLEAIWDIWRRPWLPPEDGGCPRLPLPPPSHSTVA
eukprot:TRINITY_DN16564_c0_g1_i1.p1 TRINITY_DN16564_c0_g1~~TRINITY_DN16564_c0_g1_i1.p1  ORF type:complete len:309 (+),score=36.90 TRINITY_DN16564_c0_g1_i1:28-954(+)